MSVTSRAQNPHAITIAIIIALLLLACGPLNRLQDLNRKGRVLATGVAVIGKGNYLAFEAYEKLQRLPGYRLEDRSTVRDQAGNLSTLITIKEYDPQGNAYILTLTPDGQQNEIYFVDGHTYVFENQYDGWTDRGATTPAEAQQTGDSFPAELNRIENVMQLLPQFGAVPTEAGKETIQNRPVTRYELEYVTAELAETFGDQVDAVTNLHGTLWIDDQTGALLKSEIFLYDKESRQPRREFLLEVSEIGNIAPILPPSPVIDPAAIVAATATAQAWSVLQVTVQYQNQPISFELAPIRVSPASPDSPNLSAGMQISLRQLPSNLPLDTEAELFLEQLSLQLTLSIPEHNKMVTSSGFEIESIDSRTGSMEAVYFFDADLEDFSYVELIVARQGNPLFVPVPVEGNQ